MYYLLVLKHPGRVFAGPEQRYMRVMHVSRIKACAARYPWVMHAKHPFEGYKGEVICADGSGPWAGVLQGTWIRKTGKDEFIARWERKKGTNDQVAVSPKYVCWQWVHVYGTEAA